MRLIDADALIARVESDIKVIEDIEPQMAMGAIGVLNTIKKAPTEDVKACKEQKSKLEETTSKTETVDTPTNTPTDLISRQAAIELACWRCKKCERKDCEYKDSCETMSLLEALPSEDPKPPVEPKQSELHIDQSRGYTLKTDKAEVYSKRPKGECRTCKRCSDHCCETDDDFTRCPIEEHYMLPKDGYCHLYDPIWR